MTQVQGQGPVRTVLCFGDSNTWGCRGRRHVAGRRAGQRLRTGGVGAAVPARLPRAGGLFAGAHVRSSDIDGIHLDAPAHQRLGVVIAREVRRLLA